MKSKVLAGLCIIIFLAAWVTACQKRESISQKLNPEDPVVVTLWHYHSGTVKALFEQQVQRFNETIGKDTGIIIDSYGKGNPIELSEAIYDAISHEVGSEPVPHIFVGYPYDIYQIDQMVPIVNLEDYFSRQELEEYEPTFLNSGNIDGHQKLLPITKSTECIYLNKTEWEPFAEETGLSLKELNTWEGISHAAELYYQWTDKQTEKQDDGKAFWGMDSIGHFVLMLAQQSGEELFQMGEEEVHFTCSESLANKIWSYYYIPALTGRYLKTGIYAHANIAAGDTILSIETTAGASYLPLESIKDGKNHSIEMISLPYPSLKEGKAYAPLRGVDMCIVKSDKLHEYAASVFLKWITSEEENLSFATMVGYLPVKKETLKQEKIREYRKKTYPVLANKIIDSVVETSFQMLENTNLYMQKPFQGNAEILYFLEQYLVDNLEKQKAQMEEKIKNGEDRENVVKEAISEEHFQIWYHNFLDTGNSVLKKETTGKER